jgi:hypothetical protein
MKPTKKNCSKCYHTYHRLHGVKLDDDELRVVYRLFVTSCTLAIFDPLKQFWVTGMKMPRGYRYLHMYVACRNCCDKIPEALRKTFSHDENGFRGAVSSKCVDPEISEYLNQIY